MTRELMDGLGQMLRSAQVELPPQLRARLLAIPHMPEPVSIWSPRWTVPAAILGPAVLWLGFSRGPAAMEFLTAVLAGLTGGLAFPTFPALSLLPMGAAMVALMGLLGLGTWLYIRAETRHDILYARRMTRAALQT